MSVSLTCQLFYPLGKRPGCFSVGVWLSEPVWDALEKRNSCPCPQSNPISWSSNPRPRHCGNLNLPLFVFVHVIVCACIGIQHSVGNLNARDLGLGGQVWRGFMWLRIVSTVCSCERGNTHMGMIKGEEFLQQLNVYWYKKILTALHLLFVRMNDCCA